MFNKKQQQLINLIYHYLAPGSQIVAVNYSGNKNSIYFLIKLPLSKKLLNWVTLRVGNHPSWLDDAHQLKITWPINGKSSHLELETKLGLQNLQKYSYQLSNFELAVLKQSLILNQVGLIWFLRMSETMAKSHKKESFSLITDFSKLPLFLGWRNNYNHFLLSINCPQFLKTLLELFGKNFWFGQFSSKQMLKLLPTQQWLDPVFQIENRKFSWQKEIAQNLGLNFLEKTAYAIKQVE